MAFKAYKAVGLGLFLLVSLYGNVGCLWVLFDMLEEEMGSINRQNDWVMEESVMPILHLEACSTETDQDLRPCFSQPQLRQGRSFSLPTLPFQEANRYAVVGIISSS